MWAPLRIQVNVRVILKRSPCPQLCASPTLAVLHYFNVGVPSSTRSPLKLENEVNLEAAGGKRLWESLDGPSVSSPQFQNPRTWKTRSCFCFCKVGTNWFGGIWNEVRLFIICGAHLAWVFVYFAVEIGICFIPEYFRRPGWGQGSAPRSFSRIWNTQNVKAPLALWVSNKRLWAYIRLLQTFWLGLR